MTLFLFLVFTRSDVETTLLRAPGSLYQTTTEGRVQNIYTLKVVNKTMHDIPVDLKIENMPGGLKVMGTGELVAPAANLAQSSVLIDFDPKQLTGASTKLELGVYSKITGKRLETIETAFVGPR